MPRSRMRVPRLAVAGLLGAVLATSTLTPAVAAPSDDVVLASASPTDGGAPAAPASPSDPTASTAQPAPADASTPTTSASAPADPSAMPVPAPAPSASGDPSAAPDASAPMPVPDPNPSSAPTDGAFSALAAPSIAAAAWTPIADIQGTTDTSPLVGQTVTTRGVVTAAYPTGGFNSYVIQTPGTGGAIDLATHTASDGLYIYINTLVDDVRTGDYLEVTGTVAEFKPTSSPTNGRTLTQLTVTTPATRLDASTVTGPTPATVGLPRTDAQRESLESMLVAPQGDFTVSNAFSINNFAEIGLAAGTTPLISPTEIARPGTPAYDAAMADNAARAIALDDGASTNFLGSSTNKNIALPWLSDATISVGSRVSFTSPVVFDWRNNAWKLQPTTQLVAGAPLPATFTNAREAAPRAVGGDVKISSFNVMNYFTTTGDSQSSLCTSYKDRANNPIAVNSCPDPGVRGAWNTANLTRQQDKIVAAINRLTADVVSLEEIENSVKFGKDRDDALSKLVAALNAAAGSDVWAFVPSPAASGLPPLASQDVIRTAFIYKKAVVEPVGGSTVLTDSTAFSNARQPLAQTFKPVGGFSTQAFLAIVNHFKSKSSGADAGDGQGASNADRVAQANALVTFADQQKTASGVQRVYLLGDFNAYSQEDPIQILRDAGYIDQTARTGEYTYSFSGQSGSLDHIFANTAGNASVTGADVWKINSGEAAAYLYSRYNYNVTNFYAANQYAASDHDPVVVGLSLPAVPPAPVSLNLLNINDFHGRIDSNTVKFAGTIEKLRAAAGESNTLFLSDGDNIGASLFASSAQKDQPTIDVLNTLGLVASSVGNHEFDQGLADLQDRVIGASSANATWDYLGANVYRKGTQTPALKEYKVVTVNGLRVGIIGAVTQETSTLVSPAGIATLDFGDPVAAVNRVAAQLTDGDPANGEADVLIAEYHEGAGAGMPEGATLAQEVAAGGAFADIVTKTSAKVNAIFTGHTHKQYAWDAQIPGAAPGATRPVLQTGSYGENIGQVQLTVDPLTRQVTAYTAKNVARVTTADADLVAAYPRVAQVKRITDAALASSAKIGEERVGTLKADITTAYTTGAYTNGVYTAPADKRDDRASESALGDLVANSLVDTLSAPAYGAAEIGVVNPGGLRAELLYKKSTFGNDADGVITYAEANAVLPFANNLWTTSMTGAQFRTLLEQQWQRDAKGAVPSRPYLQLGLSSNVTYTSDPTRPEGSRITGVWVNGVALDAAKSYRVGTFSFLLEGGDNFTAFTSSTKKQDAGIVDRDAWIAYLKGHQNLTPDFARQASVVQNVPTAPAAVGSTVEFDVSKLDLTSLGSPANSSLAVSWTGSRQAFTSVPVTDGAAHVALRVPGDAAAASDIVLTAQPSGTVVHVPLVVSTGKPAGDPVAAGEQALLDALRDLIQVLGGSALVPGQTITIHLDGQYAGAWISAWIYSTPTALGGWQQVAADGTVTVTIPTGLPAGAHRIAIQDASGNVIGWTAVTLGTLATTGDPWTVTLATGTALLILGGAVLMAMGGIRRRRREV